MEEDVVCRRNLGNMWQRHKRYDNSGFKFQSTVSICFSFVGGHSLRLKIISRMSALFIGDSLSFEACLQYRE